MNILLSVIAFVNCNLLLIVSELKLPSVELGWYLGGLTAWSGIFLQPKNLFPISFLFHLFIRLLDFAMGKHLIAATCIIVWICMYKQALSCMCISSYNRRVILLQVSEEEQAISYGCTIDPIRESYCADTLSLPIYIRNFRFTPALVILNTMNGLI